MVVLLFFFSLYFCSFVYFSEVERAAANVKVLIISYF